MREKVPKSLESDVVFIQYPVVILQLTANDAYVNSLYKVHTLHENPASFL